MARTATVAPNTRPIRRGARSTRGAGRRRATILRIDARRLIGLVDGQPGEWPEVAALVNGLDCQFASARGEGDRGAEGAAAGDGRSEAEVHGLAVDARQVGHGSAAWAVVARRREGKTVGAATQRGQRHVGGCVGWRAVVVVVAAVLLVVTEGRPLRLACGSL